SKPPKEGDMLRPTTDVTPLSMPMRKLGKTGAMVSAVGIGGAHLGTQTDEKESIAIIRSALDRGRDLSRQLLGLQRRQERGSHGKSAARGLSSKGLFDDEARWANERRGPAAARAVVTAAADR